MAVTRRIQSQADQFLRGVERGKRRALFRAGGYGRTSLRRLFRRKKSNSKAGESPVHHTRFKGLAAFELNDRRQEVAIGMSLTRGINRDLAGSLEDGGITRAGTSMRFSKARGTGAKTFQLQRVRRRPFMRKLVDKIERKVEDIFVEQLKKI